MRVVGRWLQIAALVLAPLSMFLPPAPPGKFTFPGPTLTMLIATVCVFCLGRLIEGYAK